mmetsp:Transcript_33636/g.74468  ORF Transcript_33636/g.74468 Transcript_33636/m.74468 type:complete len:456 (-) Transcript_33636:523-1890(-)|eukprot:CAMPEP_0202903582 /NCGR_PEP_ID=MMETSP1392-20130828/25236_1 /ASSEMBLY_ACC=CAM_ASM_000868 /TAXON_ID=225041 /ORGANISM="Chlamydomonas chlamydogama, Strain SAG 11-48b" /LENGTH=455 /DNA_ID=CAMNT_0049590831 /DNA_START=31 /DNA_END=1398 /DNA_ORIENTATION=+
MSAQTLGRTRPFSAQQRPKAPARAGAVRVQAVQKDPKKRIVITGIGISSCFGNDPDVFYSKLLEGVSGVGPISRFDTAEFPTKFGAQIKDFNVEGLIDAKNARRYDDCLKYSVVSGRKALIQAGLDKEKNPEGYSKLDLTRVGVLIGTGMGGLTVFQDGVVNLVQKGVKKISPFFIPYAITNMGGALLAIDQGFMGPNYSISTACATANYAFVAAANHIRQGDADVMVVGGSEAPIIPVGLGGFVACRALSTRNDEPEKASRPWDVDRDGFVMGEGAGVLVFESLEHAQKRGAKIIAEYLGGAVTCDAHHMTDPRADGLGVSTCIQLALKDSGIEREQVNYINAHATSTLVGDIAEVKAIKKVFSETKHIKMNATKSLIGHCLGAAGGMEAIATIKAIETGWVHPTLNQHNLIDEVSGIDTVPFEKKQHKITAGISNSFGFGGHNSVCVFAPFQA